MTAVYRTIIQVDCIHVDKDHPNQLIQYFDCDVNSCLSSGGAAKVISTRQLTYEEFTLACKEFGVKEDDFIYHEDGEKFSGPSSGLGDVSEESG